MLTVFSSAAFLMGWFEVMYIANSEGEGERGWGWMSGGEVMESLFATIPVARGRDAFVVAACLGLLAWGCTGVVAARLDIPLRRNRRGKGDR